MCVYFRLFTAHTLPLLANETLNTADDLMATFWCMSFSGAGRYARIGNRSFVGSMRALSLT